MDAEEVTSIEDTVESMQVAEEIRNTYYEHFGNHLVAGNTRLLKMEEYFGNPSPIYTNILTIPENVDEIKWLKYNHGTAAEPEWGDLTYLPPEEFFEMITKNTVGDNMQLVNINSMLYFIDTTKKPEYWTSPDNSYIVVDSVLIADETDEIIDATKTIAMVQQIPAFTLEDATIPQLEDKLFPMLLAEAKSACFVNYKGVANSKEEQRSRRQLVRHQNNRARYNEHKESKFNYGRS